MRSHGGASRTRVAVMPAAHPAVRRITGLDGLDHIELLPLRPDAVRGETRADAAPAEQVASDELPDGVRRDEVHPGGDPLWHIDVAHVHFGYDYLDAESADDMVAYLADAGVPMVLTVHDIVYPSHEDDAPHRDHTATLVEAASRVITLTEVAAQELWVRWGVEAVVVPHPRLLDEPEISTAIRSGHHLRGGDGTTVVGVLLERMGENIEGPELLDLLAPVASGRQSAHLRIVVEAQAWRDACGEDRESGGHHLVAELAAEGDWESVRLVRYEALDLGPVLAEFAALDVCVLPYRFATHSTWLELCRDLGVAPVFPAVGCLREQWFDRCDPSEHSGEVYDPRDPGALTWAVRTAIDEPRGVPPRVEGADPAAVMAAHEQVYRKAALG
ncbi:hypothetical protein [Rhodococcus sp. IEGM 1408]|uniref:hypothetical protein n=1 Tax=Rhodococcus sp. IEGM 1408 TaxID=3082220 RepID=UPI0029550010|nr:hypothetical protein [Rhodococcus sp. IEGM 1408]MDV8001647.1 hypothetical protein [Rhodococcus sp. IEGM 1408]